MGTQPTRVTGHWTSRHPGFRGATLVGAIVAVVALIALIGLLRSRRRARMHARRLEADLQNRSEAPGPPS